MRDIGVIGPEGFFPCRERPLVEWVGIGSDLFFIDPSVALAVNDLAELAKCDMDRQILLRCTHADPPGFSLLVR